MLQPRRPLRTYGKRKAAIEGDQSPPKRTRAGGAARGAEQTRQPPPARCETPFEDSCIWVRTSPTPSPCPSPALTPPPKSSILRYFKKSSASGPEEPEALDSPDDPASSSPPPPLPDTARKPRVPRRLTTRPERLLDGMCQRRGPGGETARAAPMAQSPAPAACRPTAKRPVKSPSATVQMTLSLSARGGNITQCKECDMLYNPLHPSDVKHHARHHASLARMKATQ